MPATPPAALVGRRSEHAELVAAVSALVTGRGRALLIEGEPGIGKSTLVRAAADQATAEGCQVLWASCDELSQAFSLVPILDALGVRESAPDPRRAGVARLLRGDPTEAVGTDVVTAAAERLLSLVDELCGTGPVLFAVDDLQWADAATVLVWSRLARAVQQVPLLLIGMMRPVPRREDLVALRRVVGTDGRLVLSGMPDEEVVRLVTEVAGGPPGPKLRGLAAGAAGNPLYLTELCAELVRSGKLQRDGSNVELGEMPRSTSLSVAVSGRLGFVSEPTRDVLHTAALLGSDFTVPELAVVSGRRAHELAPAIEEAIAAGVLADDEAHGLAFRHPLIRQALYDGVSPAVRAEWHAEAGRALAGAAAPVDRVARQLLVAVNGPHRPSGLEDDWLTEWLVGAGEEMVWRVPQVAIKLLRAATEGRRGTALLTSWLADALYRTGDVDGAEKVAADGLTREPEPDVLVDLHWTSAQCLAAQGRSAECVSTLETALATSGLERRHRARLLVLLARAHRNHGDVDAARRVATQALAEADAVEDRSTTGWALAMLAMVQVMRGEHAEALPLFDRALAVAAGDERLADLSLLLGINHAVALGELDRYDDAIATAQDAWRLADNVGNVVRGSQAQSVLSELLFDTGRWDDALADVPLMDSRLGYSRNPVVECVGHGIAATIKLHRGDMVGAQGHLAAAERFAPMIGRRVVGPLALARSLEREQAGALDDALAVLTEALSGDAEELQESEDLLADAVRLAVATGNDEAARTALTRAEELARLSDAPRRLAAAQHCRGLLLHDPGQLALAAEGYRAAGRPLPRAQALEAAGLALAESGDVVGARRHFTGSFAGYEALGAVRDLSRLQARFRGYGIRRGPSTPHRRSRSGWDSLTATELRIAGMVARGMSNPAIAEELFLSRRTVQTHVSHILTKLGLNSRFDVARYAPPPP
ncbi:MAG TPA: AAA family ATPase [Pseudonocardiaceae bacterium]